MEFIDLVKTRRSCRSFDDSPVSEQQLTVILEAGCWAPSPLNLQPWEFIIVTDVEIKSRIRQVAEDAKLEVVNNDGPNWAQKYKTDFLEEAPVLVVVVVDPSRAGLGKYFGQEYGAIQAGAICIQNMMLAAANLGLGSILFTFFRPQKLRAILDIPEKFVVIGLIPIGKPAVPTKTTSTRKGFKIHSQRYGNVSMGKDVKETY